MVEFEFWWLLVVPFFFLVGWIAARIDIRQIISESTDLPTAYFKGLNFIIDNEYEKAVECFEQAVKIKKDSLELHFVLGSLLRKTGQIDKAINLHIGLIQKKELSKPQTESVNAELAQDYFKAGLFGRSEEILVTLKSESYYQFALNTLIEIYVREREWNKAINTASELEKNSGVSFRVAISHYHCEVATTHVMNKKYEQAKKSLQKALQESKNCVRANILLGDIALEEKLNSEALVYWKKIEFQQPEYLGLVGLKLMNTSQLEGETNDGLSVLARYYDLYKLKTLLNTLYSSVLKNEGVNQARDIARNELIQRPSLQALDQLF